MKQFSVTIDKRQPGSSRVKKDTSFDGCSDNPLFSNCTLRAGALFSRFPHPAFESSRYAREKERRKKWIGDPPNLMNPHAEFIVAGWWPEGNCIPYLISYECNGEFHEVIFTPLWW